MQTIGFIFLYRPSCIAYPCSLFRTVYSFLPLAPISFKFSVKSFSASLKANHYILVSFKWVSMIFKTVLYLSIFHCCFLFLIFSLLWNYVFLWIICIAYIWFTIILFNLVFVYLFSKFSSIFFCIRSLFKCNSRVSIFIFNSSIFLYTCCFPSLTTLA